MRAVMVGIMSFSIKVRESLTEKMTSEGGEGESREVWGECCNQNIQPALGPEHVASLRISERPLRRKQRRHGESGSRSGHRGSGRGFGVALSDMGAWEPHHGHTVSWTQTQPSIATARQQITATQCHL